MADLFGIVTPSGLHYERHHAGIPAIEPDAHRLLIHGLVERPLIFGIEDILRFPAVSRFHFMECSGNTALWKSVPPTWTVQDTHGLISCSEWTGVRVADLLGETGVARNARWVLAEGADAALMTRSIPLAKILDDAIVAYAQNGERLRPEQGYPLRLFLPGYEGNTSVKWLRRLKLMEQPAQSREETSKYTDLYPDGKARQFTFIMDVKSVITGPSGGQVLRERGFREIRGLAWSGHGAITRVEVSADGGAHWTDAVLQPPVLPLCLTRFTLPWHWDGQSARLMSRATDDKGRVQPSRAALISARGTNSVYHYNAIQTWQVSEAGEVSNAA